MLQMCEDVKTNTSDGETCEAIEVCVKKAETQDLDFNNHGNILDVSHCEVCKSFFFNKCEVHGAPFYIADTPVSMGVPDRARQTLPPGLEIQKSSIPDAGLGVFNKGEIIPTGAHFGPYQGELVDREEAMNSEYSWVISRTTQSEEYIDGTRETHANWMRYVNCAQNDEEKNLVAFQYCGGILYRCCRTIYPEQELLVYYEEEYAKELSPVFAHLWNKKCTMNDIQGRKRLRNQENWKKNIRKRLRNSGQEYSSVSGKVVAAKTRKQMVNHQCRLKCADKITEDQRQKIFEGFWGLGTWSLQNSYICGLVKQRNVARRYSDKGCESRRTFTRDFYLTSNEGSVRVCKAMFLGTLDISNGRLTRALSSQLRAGEGTPNADRRGQHLAANKTAVDAIQHVHRHI